MAEGEEPGAVAAEPRSAVLKPFHFERHVTYYSRNMQMLPGFMASLDTNRATLVFFCVSGLDLIHAPLQAEQRQHVIDWLYSLQVIPSSSEGVGGFRGSSHIGNPFCPDNGGSAPVCAYDGGHLAMTYTALALLGVLKADLSRIQRPALLRMLRAHQVASGSFVSNLGGGEEDMRFLYCACTVATMIKGLDHVDAASATAFVQRCITHEGGIAQEPGLEAHAGSTYCAVASLAMLGTLDEALADGRRERLIEWLLQRQETGFNGRPNKLVDTCYSFWVGGSLAILGALQMADQEQLFAYLHSTESDMGGFAKHPGGYPDPLHAYMGLAGVALWDTDQTKALNPCMCDQQLGSVQESDVLALGA
ncbi:uncharacterized protein MONBRDRAFT_15046 [Monosiga brevicollis MX1]|uniref:Geranylgeranyl transferase type-1 subunit beta n=1 Tax=Monosiga brevicollis TaxID=81824 RepID=A9UTN7_MONBE|nr:uncharacterized protein MONBRDRAFT_15046 [Monosiga brevicollis MX1]EDQ91280.1 predicted protein [Monosiga brevicollis MX1]|eukprot:XP_001743702.1 hypothetical protein [Monosiga brevicollis MX1]